MRKAWITFFTILAAVLLIAGCGGTKTVTHTVTRTTPVTQASARALLQSYSALQPVLSGGRYRPADWGQPFSTASKRSTRKALPTYAGYDSVNAAADPFGAAVLSCYAVGSRFANCPQVAARHPQHILTVAVASWIVARCADIEPTDLTPSQAGSWARMVMAHGIRHPCFYSSGSWMPAVQQAAQASGLRHCTPTTPWTSPCYLTHVAEWDNNPAIPLGQDGIQWKSTPSLDYDTYYRYYFAPTTPPKPPVQHMQGTANMSAGRNIQWGYYGTHGTKGTWKSGVENYWAGVEFFFGHAGKIYYRPIKRNPSQVANKGTYWHNAAWPATQWGYHFNASHSTWLAWESKHALAPNFNCGPYLKAIAGFQVKRGLNRIHRDGCVNRLPKGTKQAKIG